MTQNDGFLAVRSGGNHVHRDRPVGRSNSPTLATGDCNRLTISMRAPPVDTPRTLLCAIYTRTSRDGEGEQAFGSIDAQREVAYIANQQHLNWRPPEGTYDDPNVSGATLERSLLHRLMTDIEAGGIDVVVVHKLDRLTRCLADFSEHMAVLDRHHVSVVSVTASRLRMPLFAGEVL